MPTLLYLSLCDNLIGNQVVVQAVMQAVVQATIGRQQDMVSCGEWKPGRPQNGRP